MGGSLSWVNRTARPDIQGVGDTVGLLVPIGGYSRRTDRHVPGDRTALPPNIFRRKPNKRAASRLTKTAAYDIFRTRTVNCPMDSVTAEGNRSSGRLQEHTTGGRQ